MISSRPIQGTRPFFLKNFCCSNDFVTQKVFFLRLEQSVLLKLEVCIILEKKYCMDAGADQLAGEREGGGYSRTGPGQLR
jgi:hypothetical protein